MVTYVKKQASVMDESQIDASSAGDSIAARCGRQKTINN